jgi:hypothetical protein
VDARLLENLRALGAEPDRLPEIPRELADYIAALTPEDLDRIRGDVKELERTGLVPKAARNGRRRE